MRPLPPTSLLAGNGLPLALGGSALLHLGLLFGLPADAPGSGHAAQPMTVRMVAASPAPAAATIPVPSQPPAARPQPLRHVPQQHKAAAPAAQPATPTSATPIQPAPAPVMQAALAPAPTVSVPLLSTTTYYEDGQLDTPPRLLGDVEQIYPARARTESIEGSVTLSLLIDEDGHVDEVRVIGATPRGYFEQAALDMLRRQRFSPALIHDHPVKSRWRTTVRYRLQS